MVPLLKRGFPFVVVSLVVMLIVTHGITRGEFDYNVDESQHAASGLFVTSLIKDSPAHPIAYTYRYYSQYPALSGVIHWPPLFYLWEGIFFLVLGPTVVAARLAILMFALLACFYWFRLARELLGTWAAVFSTLIIALLPSLLLFEKTVMLEIPCLALCIAALYYWHRYLTGERLRDLYWFALAFSAALLTKHSAIFLIPVCLASVIAFRKWQLLDGHKVLGPLAVIFILTAPFYAVVYVVHWKIIAMDLVGRSNAVGGKLLSQVQSVLFYAKALPAQLGWPLLILAAIGVATSRWWSKREHIIFMLAWIGGCYITFTLISHKEPRYSLYWVPPLVFFAVGPLVTLWKLRAARLVTAGVAAVLLVHTVVAGWNYQRPYIEGYESLASRLKQMGRPGVVLFSAAVPANFIFFLRRVDFDRQFVVLRKALRTVGIKPAGGVENLATTPDQVRSVIAQDGVKYVVVADAAARFEGERSLQALVRSEPRFKLLGAFPVESNESDWQVHNLYLYENTGWAPPTSPSLHIRMLTSDMDVDVPWEQVISASAPKVSAVKPDAASSP